MADSRLPGLVWPRGLASIVFAAIVVEEADLPHRRDRLDDARRGRARSWRTACRPRHSSAATSPGTSRTRASAPRRWRASRPPTTAGAIPFGLTLAELSDDQEMSVSGDGVDRRRQVPHGRRTLLSGGAPGTSGRRRRLLVDEHPVTNGEFSCFVADTGHVTFAERPPDPSLYPEASPEQLVPGSIVFRQPGHRVGLDDWRRWWDWVPGASWRHPEGPSSSLDGLEDHPVVHVAHEDAKACARWAGKQLPTEAQWSTRREEGRTERSTPGVTTPSRVDTRWRTPGRASFPGTISNTTGSRARHPSDRSHRTATASST